MYKGRSRHQGARGFLCTHPLILGRLVKVQLLLAASHLTGLKGRGCQAEEGKHRALSQGHNIQILPDVPAILSCRSCQLGCGLKAGRLS